MIGEETHPKKQSDSKDNTTDTNHTLTDNSNPGHDRSLTLCVNDPVCWKSTSVLQTTECPDEDLILLVPRHIVTPPVSNVQLSTSGVLQVRVGFE
jgi:hypothetical protein